MKCLWIKHEKCMWEDAYDEMKRKYQNPSVSWMIPNEFGNKICKFCLEGKKIEKSMECE